MLRILHVLDHSLPHHSGYVFRTLSILAEQRHRGWETLHLTSPKQGVGAAVEEDIDGWRFLRTCTDTSGTSRLPGLGEVMLMRATAARIEEICQTEKPDILHAHSPVLNALPALRVARRLDLPVVYEVRAFWEDAAVDHGTAAAWGLRYRATRELETYVLKRVDAVFTICEGLKSDIVARGIGESVVTVIPNAVDIEEFAAAGPPDGALRRLLGLEGAYVLGFIGSFYAYEGLDLLLAALPKVLARLPHTRVLLVGGGQEEAYLKSLATQTGIADHVVFAGRVPHAQVMRYYGLIDLLVYARRPIRLTELVTPLKPLEAMAQRRLFVASDVGGHRELIRDGETGFLFRSGDVEALARRIVEIHDDREGCARVCEACYRFVSSARTWRASVARYEPVYARLVTRTSWS